MEIDHPRLRAAAWAAALIDQFLHHCHIVNIRGHARPDTKKTRQTSPNRPENAPKAARKGDAGPLEADSRLEKLHNASPSIRGIDNQPCQR